MTRLVRQDSDLTQGRDQRPDAIRFCTHCGAVSDDAPQRVCNRCGLGVLLSCAREAAPRPDAPFLIVTSDLRVSAASAAVEPLLGNPDALRGESVLDLVRSDGSFPRKVARAAMGSKRPADAWVRVGDDPRPRRAVVAACGDPPAALIALL
jgi:hypothetical protein